MLVRRKWASEGMHPVVVVTTGSHQKTCVFGTLCIDRRQFFRQYNTFNQSVHIPGVFEGITKQVS
jgi:hypothetical protein